LRGPSPCIRWGVTESVLSHLQGQDRDLAGHLQQPRAVFNLLNPVAGKKGTSRDPEFSNSQSPKDTANIYASYLRLHFSQQTPRLSRGAERGFMNNLRSDQCSDSSLHSTFCSPSPRRNSQLQSPTTKSNTPLSHVPSPPVIAKLGAPATLLGDEIFLTLPLLPGSFGFLKGAGPSPSRPLWTVPISAATVTAFSYLCRIKRKENSSCSACVHPLQDLTHLLLDFLHLSFSGAPSLALLLFLTSSPTLGRGPTVGSP